MLFVENNNTDPYRNHALEEWLMDNLDEDCFMLWRNQKAILLGKNQNAHREIDLPYARQHGIKIVRRITGGGTVFTDAGNIMFTFISCDDKHDYLDFQKFTRPILQALQALGVPAEFTGRNDLVIDGRKFSGNAQCRYGSKVLHHGTLMYQADTGELARVLRVRPSKLESKGVASVRSRVTNISQHMWQPMEIEAFRAYLFNYVKEAVADARLYRLTPEEWAAVAQKAGEKHATDQWIYGDEPQYNTYREAKLPGGLLEIYLDIQDGVIRGVRIMGDFFSGRGVQEIENALLGTPYTRDAVRECVSRFDVGSYFYSTSAEELAAALA